MESLSKSLKKNSEIYLLRFRPYCDKYCIFVGSDVINQQLRIRIGRNQRNLIIA